jgi:hypothetical protein
MNPRKLIHGDTGSEFGWCCGRCGMAWGNPTFGGADGAAFDAANSCCRPHVCECGKPSSPGWTICSACRDANERDREHRAYLAATKVLASEYGGVMVYASDEYFDPDDDDEWLDHGRMTDGVRWAWGCEPTHGPNLDADEIIYEALEEHHEGAIDRVDVAGLRSLLDEWCAANPVVSYDSTEKVVVIWDGEEEAAS